MKGVKTLHRSRLRLVLNRISMPLLGLTLGPTAPAATFRITASDNGYINSVTETRGAETRTLPRGRSWAAWTLYSGTKE